MVDAGRPTGANGPSGPSDEALLERVAQGDAVSLDLIYERYRSVAYGLAARITGDAVAAEDVLQEAFLGVWRHAASYAAARSSVRTWILSIVHHRAIDVIRRRRPTTPLDDPDSETGPTVPDVWEEVAGRLDRRAVGAALATLPAAQRDVLELAYFGGLTQVEIAERTGAPLGTVKSRARLGLLAMRQALAGAIEAGAGTAMRAGVSDVPADAKGGSS